MVVNCDGALTDMCLMGFEFFTDKSPVNHRGGSRHSYTPIYNLLFASIRGREINVAEIGTLTGEGLKLFREFFPSASLFGFEGDAGMRKICEELELPDTKIVFVDVCGEDSIREAFESTGCLFDIIVDDSSHRIDDQLRLIRNCVPFLKTGGYLIVEDIYDDARAPEEAFEEVVKELGDAVSFSSFIIPKSRRSFTEGWNNEKLLLLIKG